MSRRYFGTDGIRGTVGQEPITPDFMLRLGHAVGHGQVGLGQAPEEPHGAAVVGGPALQALAVATGAGVVTYALVWEPSGTVDGTINRR